MKMPVMIRILLTASLALLAQFSAQAHTALAISTPAANATVSTPPTKIDLVFTESVKLLKLQLMGVGHEMPTSFEPGSDSNTSYSFETPGMHPGKFTVNWAVIGADGHTVTNSYSFTVDPAAADSAGN